MNRIPQLHHLRQGIAGFVLIPAADPNNWRNRFPPSPASRTRLCRVAVDFDQQGRQWAR